MAGRRRCSSPSGWVASSAIYAAHAVDELLRRAERGAMGFLLTVDKTEGVTEFAVE